MRLDKPKKRYKFLKGLLIVAGLCGLILLVFSYWYVNNAHRVLKEYIFEESGGKIKLELSKLKLNLLTNRLQIYNAELVSIDSLTAPITYHVSFSNISVQVGSLWALVVEKKIILDSVKLYNPVIQVIQWRRDTAQVVVKDELSIPQEMGKMYNSMLNALDEFGVRRIVINNATVSLVNKMTPGSLPVTVSKIYFDLARSPVKKGRRSLYSKEGQSVALQTSNQHITLPGGRHSLSFKSFNLHLFREVIEMDSCTITAIASDTLKSNYKIFFKKLLLTGVDFYAMSAENVIKADSVYCENPLFDFTIYRSDAVKKNTEIPDANQIVRELTGNLDLAYVGVQNAGLHFDIYDKTKRSFFNSNKDNFEILDFRINPASPEPVSIRRFDMKLKDYHLYNEDSTSVFTFDSLHLLNSRIVLNNFGIHTRPGKKILRDQLDISVPYFELTALNWSELIFNQSLEARDAVLNNPVINFTRKKFGASDKKINLFDALQSIDSLVALGNVTVVNGQATMHLGPTTSFHLQQLNFKILSNRFLSSVNKEGLRSAVDHLSFSKGTLRLEDLTAELQHARFSGSNLLFADKVAIREKGNRIVATVNKVNIDNLQLDDNAENIEVDGLGWQSAVVALRGLPATKNTNSTKSSIHIKNVAGNNTSMNITAGPVKISTVVENLDASSIYQKGSLLRVEDFVMEGKNLEIQSNKLTVNAGNYLVSGDQPSILQDVVLQQIHGQDSLYIRSSRINFTTNLNDVFANVLHLSNVAATAPVIIFSKWDTATIVRNAAATPMPFSIARFAASEPAITISTYRKDSVTIIHIPRAKNSLVQATGIHFIGQSMQVASLLVNTTAATFIKPGGETIGIEDGRIDMSLSDLQLSKKDSILNWSGFINSISLQNARGLNRGKSKNNLRFNSASLGKVHLSSKLLPDFSQLLRANVAAWIRIPQGEYIDSNITFIWYNAHYTNSTKTLTLDSLVYHPTQPLDSVLAYAPYELDYITAKSGTVTISGFDIEKFEKDSSLNVKSITLANPVLTVYRDKLPPSSPFKRKNPLPVDLLKNLKLPVSVDSIVLQDGLITYGEKHGTSRKEGMLALTNLNATISNIKNRHFLPGDSLVLRMKTQLMGTTELNLNLKESYTDTLSGFLIKANLQATDLAVLNPVFVPLASIYIARGRLDSLYFSAVARKDFALGEMNVQYHDLRIKMIKNGDPDQSTFTQKLVSFIANTFVIKNNNTRRKGMIYSQRKYGQSFVNYVVETTLSGILTSVGVKKNRKYKKLYKQQVKESLLPPDNLK